MFVPFSAFTQFVPAITPLHSSVSSIGNNTLYLCVCVFVCSWVCVRMRAFYIRYFLYNANSHAFTFCDAIFLSRRVAAFVRTLSYAERVCVYCPTAHKIKRSRPSVGRLGINIHAFSNPKTRWRRNVSRSPYVSVRCDSNHIKSSYFDIILFATRMKREYISLAGIESCGKLTKKWTEIISTFKMIEIFIHCDSVEKPKSMYNWANRIPVDDADMLASLAAVACTYDAIVFSWYHFWPELLSRISNVSGSILPSAKKGTNAISDFQLRYIPYSYMRRMANDDSIFGGYYSQINLNTWWKFANADLYVVDPLQLIMSVIIA